MKIILTQVRKLPVKLFSQLVALLFFSLQLFGTPTIAINLFQGNTSSYLGQSITYFQTDRNLTPEFVFNSDTLPFKNGSTEVLNFGLSEKTVWIKLKLEHHQDANKQMNLFFESLPLDTIQYFYQKADGSIHSETTGFSQPQATKTNYNRFYLLNIPSIEECPSQELLIHIATPVQYIITVRIGSFEAFKKQFAITELYYGAFFGFLLCMFFFNLLLFVRLREASYLWYSLSIFTSLIIFSSFSGHFYQYVLPSFPNIANKVLLTASGILLIVMSKFMIHALELNKKSKLLKLTYDILGVFGWAIVLGVLVLGRKAMVAPANIGVGILAINIMITSLAVYNKENRYAIYFFFAWFIYATGGILNILKNLSILPYNEVTVHSAEIGCALEVVLIAFALGEKYRSFAESKALAQKEMIALQDAHNKTLEEKVILRSNELIQANNSLQETTEKLEYQNITITESIHNAQNIQKSMLTIGDDMQRKLGDFFILLKPKDIVSGDFYWFKSIEDKLIAAAIDCTGHGVPGAMMSMLGYNSLNTIIKKSNNTEPAMILDNLHEVISSTLRQNTTRNRDGMDMALIAFDKSTRILQYAGANKGAIVIHKGELTLLKANNKSIGGRENEAPFTTHEIKLEESALVYLYTDGFQDQFGGDKGKKLMFKRVKELIQNYCHLPLKEQKEALEKEFQNWMGNHEQIDDVLLIGIKL